MQTITENTSKIKVILLKKDVSKKMEVFYNPQMESNRNISILLLNAIKEKKKIALPLAGSGIRAIRILKEVKGVEKIYVNDKRETFVKDFENNLKLNKLNTKKIKVFNKEANTFLLGCHDENFCGHFDYIELDPFGTPNPFLSSSIEKIKRGGIIVVTATDTAALTGTYGATTKRKYWAHNTKNYMMHELGLRILIRKIQLLGMQFDKALVPVLSYYKDHYVRVFLRNIKGKEKCDELLKQHLYFLYNPKTLEFEESHYNNKKGFIFIGPLWVGALIDKKLIKKMVKLNKFESERKFLNFLLNEKDIVGFYDSHVIARKYGINAMKLDEIVKKVKGSRTHFSLNGFKTDKNIKEVVKVMKNGCL
jgi:tRNA (guanine26-N2/guanine27-N2)-dimethyltransferase